MTALSEKIVRAFFELCKQAYESWRLHKLLVDDNPNYDAMSSECISFFNRLSRVTQEYALLQIAKLNDPAVQGNNINLTLEYIITYGGWDQEILSKLKKLHTELKSLPVKPARNKILAHNNLESILNNASHGEFKKGDDEEYYNKLEEFVQTVCSKTYGLEYGFDKETVEKDVQSILDHIPYKDKT